VRIVGVHVVFVSECLTLGALISGALANRMIWVCLGRLVPPWFFGAGEWERRLGDADGFGHTVGS